MAIEYLNEFSQMPNNFKIIQVLGAVMQYFTLTKSTAQEGKHFNYVHSGFINDLFIFRNKYIYFPTAW